MKTLVDYHHLNDFKVDTRESNDESDWVLTIRGLWGIRMHQLTEDAKQCVRRVVQTKKNFNRIKLLKFEDFYNDIC